MLAADKIKSTSEGKPHNINELGATGSGPPQAAAQQISALTVSGRDPEEQVYIWMLTQPFTHIQGLMLLNSGAAAFACPPSFVGNNVNLSSSGLELRSASGAEVEHFGTTSVRKQLGNQAYDISFEVAAVSGRIASISWFEDAGCTSESARAGWIVRGGQEEIEVLRRGGVFWIRVDDARNAETALRLCPFPAEVDDEPARQIRSKKIPVMPDDGTRSAHGVTLVPSRSWCAHCVKGFVIEDHHRRRDRSLTVAGRCSSTTKSCGRLQVRTVRRPVLNAVDIESLMPIAVVGQKGVIEPVIATVVSFLYEIGHQRIFLKSDHEPSVTGLTREISRRRQADNGWPRSSKKSHLAPRK